MAKKQRLRSNPAAHDLRTSKYRKRVTKDKRKEASRKAAREKPNGRDD